MSRDVMSPGELFSAARTWCRDRFLWFWNFWFGSGWITLVLVVGWLVGIAVAKGKLMTVVAVLVPVVAWYLAVERLLLHWHII